MNPQGDLKKTEKLFGEWFCGETGWEGVVGIPPISDKLSAALQEKDVYMYVLPLPFSLPYLPSLLLDIVVMVSAIF